MPDAQGPRGRTNTVAMLGQAYSLLGFRIVDGVVGAGFPRSPRTRPCSRRSTRLARGSRSRPWREHEPAGHGRARRRARVLGLRRPAP